MALALSGSGAGDSREAGSHGASTGTGTCRGEQSPEEGLTTFPSWAVMVVKAILEREKLLVGALDNELPGSPVPHCGQRKPIPASHLSGFLWPDAPPTPGPR